MVLTFVILTPGLRCRTPSLLRQNLSLAKGLCSRAQADRRMDHHGRKMDSPRRTFCLVPRLKAMLVHTVMYAASLLSNVQLRQVKFSKVFAACEVSHVHFVQFWQRPNVVHGGISLGATVLRQTDNAPTTSVHSPTYDSLPRASFAADTRSERSASIPEVLMITTMNSLLQA